MTQPAIGRILAIDYGDRRLGLAMTDPLRILASPHSVLTRGDSVAADLDQLSALIDDEQVTELVMGFPENTDGSHGEMVKKVEAFAAALLEKRPLPLHFVDESYSSLEADELLRDRYRDPRQRKALRDAFAAWVILKSHLDAR